MEVASLCAGSDAPMLVVHQVQTHFGWKAVHAFSVEKNVRKRAFIKMMFGHRMRSLYHDVLELDKGEAWDDIAGRLTAIPAANIVIGGFPCTDISSLNPRAKDAQNRRTIADGSLRTGTCFASIVQYAAKSGSSLMILENVLTLASRSSPGGLSNLDAAIERATAAGFASHAFELTPLLFGTPQSTRANSGTI
jgi:site-specific DNA-cytosine methylase